LQMCLHGTSCRPDGQCPVTSNPVQHIAAAGKRLAMGRASQLQWRPSLVSWRV